MLVQVKGQIFRRCQRTARRQDPLDDGIVGQVEEHDHPAQHAAFLKGAAEIVGHIVGDTHSGKYDGEVGGGAVGLDHLGLADDLSRQLVVPHARSGEDGELLPADQRHHTVDGGDTGVDKVAGIYPGHRVDGGTIDVPGKGAAAVGSHHGEQLPQPVGRTARTVENTAQ